jgi:hypothetical protein
MTRLGQSGMRATFDYRHAASDRDREIAGAVDKRIKKRPAIEDRNHRNVGFPGVAPGARMAPILMTAS